MDLIAYFQVFKSRWRIILIALLVTIIATVVYTFLQDPVYEAENSFVLRPKSTIIRDNQDFVRALDTLSNRDEINATIVEVANSKLVKELAAERIGVSPREMRDYFVVANVLSGTNLISIAVQGNVPETTKNFVDAISIETANYITNLYGIFQLDLLDEAGVPSSPIRPNKIFNILMGGILGLILGLGLAMLSEYLQSPSDKSKPVNIIDRPTGAYNKSYLMLCLKQEINRSNDFDYPFSLAVIKPIDPSTGEQVPFRIREEILRKTFAVIKNTARKQDLIFRVEGSTFAILMPYADNSIGNAFTNQFISQIESMSLELDQASNFSEVHCIGGLVTYRDENQNEEQLLVEAIQRMYRQESDNDLEEES